MAQPPLSRSAHDAGVAGSDPGAAGRTRLRLWQVVVGIGGIAALIGTVILMLGGDGHGPGMHLPRVGARGEPIEGTRGATVTAIDLGFEPDVLELVAGEPVNLTLLNVGDLEHDWDLPEANAHLHAESGENDTQAVVVTTPGTYQAVCTLPGHAEAGMTMTVEVRATNTPAPSGDFGHDDLDGLDEDEIREDRE
jgi:uncharacterized cupredoxin-like copper-binding protein